MSRGTDKKLTTKEVKIQSIHKMLESLIAGDNSEAEEHLHDYLQLKTRELIMGESKDEDCDEDDDDSDDKDDDKDDDDKDSDDDKDGKKEKVDEQTQSAAFAASGKTMDDKVKGKIKFENGGKKTLKKHGNKAAGLDDDKIDKTKFKSGGNQPANTLEKTPKPAKFDDGRDKELGTTKA